MLGDPQCVEEPGFVGLSIETGHGVDVLDRDTAEFRGIFGGVFFHGCFQFLKVFGALFDELLVIEILFDDDVHNPVKQRDICAWIEPQPVICFFGKFCAPRIDDDQFGALSFSLFHFIADNGMGYGSVCPHQE